METNGREQRARYALLFLTDLQPLYTLDWPFHWAHCGYQTVHNSYRNSVATGNLFAARLLRPGEQVAGTHFCVRGMSDELGCIRMCHEKRRGACVSTQHNKPVKVDLTRPRIWFKCVSSGDAQEARRMHNVKLHWGSIRADRVSDPNWSTSLWRSI